MHFSCQKTDWGAIPYHIWVPFGSYFPHFFVLLMEKCVLDTRRFFPQFLGCTECSWGWAHMQSVRVYAVKTHFSLFAFFLKTSSLESPKYVVLGVSFHQNKYVCVKKGVPKTASNKGGRSRLKQGAIHLMLRRSASIDV